VRGRQTHLAAAGLSPWSNTFFFLLIFFYFSFIL